MIQFHPLCKSLLIHLLAVSVSFGTVFAPVFSQSLNDTGDVLERAGEVEDIEFKAMVQRAIQAAIWGMPAAGTVDILKGIRRGLGWTTTTLRT